MNQETLLYILSFLTPLLLALALTPLAMAVATRFNFVDHPGHRKAHKKPVPYLGGVALFAALTLGIFITRALFKNSWPGGASLSSIPACLVIALFGVALGLYDDLFDMRARHKFVIQAFIALGFSFFGYRFGILHIPGFAPIVLDQFWANVFSVFFILSMVNAFNMIDGSDGLCAGTSIVTLLLLAMAAANYDQPRLLLMSLGALGACLGFLFWNRPPARIYLGDAGSQGLGFLIAGMLLALGSPGGPSRYSPASVADSFHYKMVVAVLLAAYPVKEITLTVLRRGLQGRNLGRADQGHIHHRMARQGFSPMVTLGAAMLFNLLCGSIVLMLMAGEKGIATLLIILVSAMMAITLQQLGFARLLQRHWLEARRPHFAVAQHYMAMQNVKLTLAGSKDELFLLISQVSAELGVERIAVELNDPHRKKANRTWSWSRYTDLKQGLPPEEDDSLVGLQDKQNLSKGRGHAVWSFMVSGNQEHELDMEMRVLMAEFMNHALTHLHKIYAGTSVEKHSYPRKSGMSIRALAERLDSSPPPT